MSLPRNCTAPGIAEHYLDAYYNQMARIEAIATAAESWVNRTPEDDRDLTASLLVSEIVGIAQDAAAYYRLRDYFEHVNGGKR